MASAFSWVITLQQVGPKLTEFITSITTSPVVLLVLVNISFLLLGCVMESIPILLIFVPILYPSVLAYGIDPIHFGVVVVLNGCESRMAVMSAAWFVEFRQRLPWLLHVD